MTLLTIFPLLIIEMTKRRSRSRSKLEEKQLKFIANAIYGKVNSRKVVVFFKHATLTHFNGFFFQSIEKCRGRMCIDFVRTFNKFNRLRNSPRYQGYHLLGDDLAIVFSMKKKAFHKKPVYGNANLLLTIADNQIIHMIINQTSPLVGATILEHSKYSMVEKLYSTLVPSFPKFDLILTGKKRIFFPKNFSKF